MQDFFHLSYSLSTEIYAIHVANMDMQLNPLMVCLEEMSIKAQGELYINILTGIS